MVPYRVQPLKPIDLCPIFNSDQKNIVVSKVFNVLLRIAESASVQEILVKPQSKLSMWVHEYLLIETLLILVVPNCWPYLLSQ
jgi:hypothetical protein